MSGVFEIGCYRSSIEEVTESVYATMLGCGVTRTEEPWQEQSAGFTAAVHYAGSWQGALLLECSAGQADRWAARLMSLVPPIALDDARDSLGEIVNVLAGNLKPLLPGGVGLSIPSVVQGSDYSFRICGGNLCEILYFADESGPFRVTLVVTESR